MNSLVAGGGLHHQHPKSLGHAPPVHVFSDFFHFLLCRKKSPHSTPKSDRHPVDVSPGTSPILSASPLNTPLNRTPVRKISRPSSAESSRRDKDNGSDGSNASSGSATPRLPHRDLETLQSASDSESASLKDFGKANNNNASTFPDLEFLREVTEGYDSMEEDTNSAKEMLLHLQNLVGSQVSKSDQNMISPYSVNTFPTIRCREYIKLLHVTC